MKSIRISLVFLLTMTTLAVGAELDFQAVEIDSHAGEICYAVTVADVNSDERPDIVVVTENRVLWYENPTWTPHRIIENQTAPDNVCIAPYDIDGDGKVDFALGAGWTKVGTIQWLSRNKEPDQLWNVHSIGVEPWLHRMRWGDVLGTGRAQLVVSPLNKTAGTGVRLLAFQIPDDPRAGVWESVLLDQSLDRLHNHWITDFNRDGTQDVLSASQEGISRISRSENGWSRSLLVPGATAEGRRNQGAGEIKVGRLSPDRKVLAAIEPMHGNMVVVYTPSMTREGAWIRRVLTDEFREGHGLWLADLDRDGQDEVIAGYREEAPAGPPSLFIFDAADEQGRRWEEYVLDRGGVAVEDVLAADLNGDGSLDIVACGRSTHNVKIYFNRSSPTTRR